MQKNVEQNGTHRPRGFKRYKIKLTHVDYKIWCNCEGWNVLEETGRWMNQRENESRIEAGLDF